MATQADKSKDAWNADDYAGAASFVPLLTQKVVSYLDVQPNDTILDLGCGDGPLTAQIAKSLKSPSQIHGLDSSPSMITTASKNYPQISFAVQDCAHLDTYLSENPRQKGKHTKIFSNAAMHWILSSSYARETFFPSVYTLLSPQNGKFVFEMGGAGCVAEVNGVVRAALLHFGVPEDRIRAATAWFFPGKKWMRTQLEKAGFEVEVCEEEYRPTELTAETEDGKGGLEGWVRLMCSAWLELVPGEKKGELLKWVRAILEPVMKREDGTWVLGYVRLRAVAVKRE